MAFKTVPMDLPTALRRVQALHDQAKAEFAGHELTTAAVSLEPADVEALRVVVESLHDAGSPAGA